MLKEQEMDRCLACTQTTPVSEQAHKTSHHLIWNEVKLLIETYIVTPEESRKLSTKDFNLIISTGIVELKFLKLENQNSLEQWGSQSGNGIRSP